MRIGGSLKAARRVFPLPFPSPPLLDRPDYHVLNCHRGRRHLRNSARTVPGLAALVPLYGLVTRCVPDREAGRNPVGGPAGGDTANCWSSSCISSSRPRNQNLILILRAASNAIWPSPKTVSFQRGCVTRSRAPERPRPPFRCREHRSIPIGALDSRIRVRRKAA